MISLIVVSAGAQSQVSASARFSEEGIASWYGSEFDGRPTASGEIFDSSQFTAAHRTLAFGSLVVVTNRHNNRQVRVRINDRGPFISSRIIDLSKAAAEVLDMVSTGTAPVLVEMLQVSAIGPVTPAAPAAPGEAGTMGAAPVPEISSPESTVPVPSAEAKVEAQAVFAFPASPAPVSRVIEPVPSEAVPVPPAPPPADAVTVQKTASILGTIPPAGTGKFYRVQVGAYRIPRNAVEAFEKLKSAGLNPAYEQSNDLYRVVLAGLKPEEIQSVAEKLMAAGFPEALIREER